MPIYPITMLEFFGNESLLTGYNTNKWTQKQNTVLHEQEGFSIRENKSNGHYVSLKKLNANKTRYLYEICNTEN